MLIAVQIAHLSLGHPDVGFWSVVAVGVVVATAFARALAQNAGDQASKALIDRIGSWLRRRRKKNRAPNRRIGF